MKIITSAVVLLFLLSFISAGITGSATMTGSAVNNEEENQGNSATNNQEAITNSDEVANIKIKNSLRISDGECPEDCTCTGSVTTCKTQSGKEMTVKAGNSGNTIFQVRGADAKTRAELYQENGKTYGVFKGNKTKEIKAMPDEVREKIRERLKLRNCSCEIELNEDGEYVGETIQRAKFLRLFSVNKNTKVYVNAETGEVIRVKKPWWNFMASDVEEEQIVGGCGTVTPEQNDACCQNLGYTSWNSETAECE